MGRRRSSSTCRATSMVSSKSNSPSWSNTGSGLWTEETSEGLACLREPSLLPTSTSILGTSCVPHKTAAVPAQHPCASLGISLSSWGVPCPVGLVTVAGPVSSPTCPPCTTPFPGRARWAFTPFYREARLCSETCSCPQESGLAPGVSSLLVSLQLPPGCPAPATHGPHRNSLPWARPLWVHSLFLTATLRLLEPNLLLGVHVVMCLGTHSRGGSLVHVGGVGPCFSRCIHKPAREAGQSSAAREAAGCPTRRRGPGQWPPSLGQAGHRAQLYPL